MLMKNGTETHSASVSINKRSGGRIYTKKTTLQALDSRTVQDMDRAAQYGETFCHGGTPSNL